MPISFYIIDFNSKNIFPLPISDSLMKEINKFLSDSQDSTIYHHPAWLQALSNESGQEAYYLIQRNIRGEIALVLPLLKTRGFPFGLGGVFASKRLSSLPRTPYAGPIGFDKSNKKQIIDSLPQWFGVDQKYVFQIKTLKKTIESSDLFNEYHWRNTYVKTLDKGSDKINFKDKRSEKDIERMIKKAESYGIKIMAAQSLEDLKRWYKLYLEKMRHHFIPPRPYRFFKSLWENMEHGKMIRLNLAYVDNSESPIGGNLSFIFKDTFYAGFKGGRLKDKHMMYDDFLWNFEIKNAQIEGLSFFDLGEVPRNHIGLERYKKKWGAEEIPIYHWYPQNSICNETKLDPGNQESVFRKLWGYIPIQVTAYIGQIINRFL
jgi:hypothetical protein